MCADDLNLCPKKRFKKGEGKKVLGRTSNVASGKMELKWSLKSFELAGRRPIEEDRREDL